MTPEPRAAADDNEAADRAAIADALQQHPLLSQLDTPLRGALAAQSQRRRYAPGEPVAEALGERLGLLARGRLRLLGVTELAEVAEAAEAAEAAGAAPGPTLQAPACFGHGTAPPEVLCGWRAEAVDDVLVAWIGAEQLTPLCEQQPWLRLFLNPAPVPAPQTGDPQFPLMRTPVGALIKRAPITLAPGTPIRDAARLMRERRVSSVLLVEGGRLVGLVTDRDLRSRVIAEGLDTARPMRDIATRTPLTVQHTQPGFDALLLMARHNIHHVPVLDGDTVAGMITATDVTEQHSTSAVFLVGDIHKQTELAGLVECAGRVRALQRSLAAAGVNASASGHIVTSITDALTVRLLQLGEARLGPAPVDYAWVAAGSQARNEQTARSDQDNCMVLDDRYDEARHGAYFGALARFVCDGLDACGYVYCPGEMMAMVDRWRQPLRVWAEAFRRWIETPEPMALMLTCVFFDVRCVAGQGALLDALRAEVLRRTRHGRLFIAHLAANALARQPPLGLFGGIATLRSGAHKGSVDLKLGGIAPVVDLARVYALAAGVDAVNTHDRLARAAESGEIGAQGVRDLRDALEFIATLRIRHQAQQIADGLPADNFLRPAALSNFERGQLRDAFVVVKQLQELLAQRCTGLPR